MFIFTIGVIGTWNGDMMLCLGGLRGLHGDNIFKIRLETEVEGGLATKELIRRRAELCRTGSTQSRTAGTKGI
jgi:hypothetical protein